MKYKVGDKFRIELGQYVVNRGIEGFYIKGTDLFLPNTDLRQLNKIIGDIKFLSEEDVFELVITEYRDASGIDVYRISNSTVWLSEYILNQFMKLEDYPKYACKIDLDDTESTSIDWEIIKQFIKLSSDEIYKIFGTWYMSSVVDIYTYEEIANKMTEYMKPKVKVGDIVERTACGATRNWLCIHINDEEYTFIDNEGDIIKLEYVNLLPVVGHCEDLVNILSKLN